MLDINLGKALMTKVPDQILRLFRGENQRYVVP